MASTSAASGSSATSPGSSIFGAVRSGLVLRPNWFELYLNVNQFRHDEVKIHVVDRSIVVHAKHSERADDHGFCCREFTRQFIIPDNVRPRNIRSIYFNNGILVIKAPKEDVSTKKSKVVSAHQQTTEAESEEDDVQLSDPDVQLSDPDVQLSDPDVQLSDPDVQLSDPDVQLSDPDVQLSDPDVQLSDPDTQLSAPDTLDPGEDESLGTSTSN